MLYRGLNQYHYVPDVPDTRARQGASVIVVTWVMLALAVIACLI